MEGKYLQLLLVIVIPIVLILGIVIQTSTSSNFYSKEIEKKGIIDEEYVQTENATKISNEIILYLKGEGVLTESLIGKEAATHMEDVKKIRDLTKYIFYGLLVMFLIGCIVLFIIHRPERIPKILVYGSIISLVINILLFVTSKFFFTSFWAKIHTIMFTNDLWQLNPETDSLVAVFTMNFFTDFIMRLVLLTTMISILFIIIGVALQLFFPKDNEPKKQQIEKEEFESPQW
tara:strand:- start:9055 stop:9750 length:696 start_codon:yes stop_codon:yes gene_type:complete